MRALGTGFCWLRPELRESLRRTQAYWLSMQTADELGEEQGAPTLRDDLGARAFEFSERPISSTSKRGRRQ